MTPRTHRSIRAIRAVVAMPIVAVSLIAGLSIGMPMASAQGPCAGGAYSIDSLNADPYGDWDNDLVPNFSEFENGTSPCAHPCSYLTNTDLRANPYGDWDGDGWGNRYEADQGMNPCAFTTVVPRNPAAPVTVATATPVPPRPTAVPQPTARPTARPTPRPTSPPRPTATPAPTLTPIPTSPPERVVIDFDLLRDDTDGSEADRQGSTSVRATPTRASATATATPRATSTPAATATPDEADVMPPPRATTRPTVVGRIDSLTAPTPLPAEAVPTLPPPATATPAPTSTPVPTAAPFDFDAWESDQTGTDGDASAGTDGSDRAAEDQVGADEVADSFVLDVERRCNGLSLGACVSWSSLAFLFVGAGLALGALSLTNARRNRGHESFTLFE